MSTRIASALGDNTLGPRRIADNALLLAIEVWSESHGTFHPWSIFGAFLGAP